MPAIVTLTPSPVLDRVYVLGELLLGRVNRATAVHEYLSGKGLNVARSVHLAGSPVSAVVPIGREDQQLLFRMDSPEIVRAVQVEGRMRVNTGIVEASGATTNVNQLAEPISAADWAHVVEVTVGQLHAFAADWLVVSGRSPVVTGPDAAGTEELVDLEPLFETAQSLGVRVAVDASGEMLERWADSPLVNLLKPNADELATLVGRRIETIGDALEAGRELVAGGLEIALVSLGGDGALVVTADTELWALADAGPIANTTGAGDAALAGYLHASLPPEHRPVLGDPLPELDHASGLAAAASWGALAVSLPTTVLTGIADAPVATLAAPDPARRLRSVGLPGAG